MKITKIEDKNIKYFVKNTPLPVIVTNEDKLCFYLSEKMKKDLQLDDPDIKMKYKEDVDATIEYLLNEGFIDKNPLEDQNDSENDFENE
jgi:hypothetical protein